MVNKTGGKKHKKYKKNRNDEVKKKLIKKDSEQEYAFLLERKGGPIMSLKLLDGRNVLGVVRGKMRRRIWMNPGDILLVAKRDFQDNKVDIIGKYSDDEVRKLIKEKEITKYFSVGGNNDDEEDGPKIIFENVCNSDEDENEDNNDVIFDEPKKTLKKDKVSYKNMRTNKINHLTQITSKPSKPMTQEEFDSI